MYKFHKLNNGINLITVPVDSVNTVNTIVYFPVGSRYEEKEYNGISHFIEHMMFKGTEKRENAYVLSNELDSIGAEYNAYTAKDMTAFYIKSSSDHLEKNIEILGDMLCNSKFDIDEINKERGVIIQEARKYKDLPEIYVEDLFEELVFGENDELGQLIIGTEDNINNFTREQFLKYKNTHYYAENAYICVTGKFNEEEVIKLIEKNFVFKDESGEKFDKTEVELLRNNKKQRVIEQSAPKVRVVYQDIEQAHLKMGFPGFSYFDDRVNVLSIASVILGGCMSSRLFTEIREKRGLCYNIYSNIDRYQDCGLFSVNSGLDKDRIFEAIEVIKEELLKLKENGITEEEMNKAKSIITGKMDVSLEDTSNLAEFYGRNCLLKNMIITPEDKKNFINKVTLSEINDIIKEVVDFNKINLAIVGPYKDDAEFKRILNK